MLAVVAAAGAPTRAELIPLRGMDQMTISRAVAPLCRRGFVNRARDTGGRRILRLSATPVGIAIYDDITARAIGVDARLLAAALATDAEALRRALAGLQAACGKS